MHAEAQASAQAQGKGQAVAQALAQAQAVAQCLSNLPRCQDQPFTQGCCDNPNTVKDKKCGCVGTICNYNLVSANPLVWQSSLFNNQQCRCA